jgi:hypothetical protein
VDPQTFYPGNLAALEKEHKQLLKRRAAFGIFRFGTLALLVALVYLFSQLGAVYLVVFAAAMLLLFRWLILMDLKNRAAIRNLEHLIGINQQEIRAISGEYYQFPDGTAYMPKDHYYANDIDIFGHASLYQFCNRTTSETGGRQLAAWLSAPAQKETILKRQEAIKELDIKRGWSQQLQALGKENTIREETYSRLMDWLHDPAIFLTFRHWRWLRILLPAIILSVTAAAIARWIPMNVLYAALFLYAVLAYQINKRVSPLHQRLSKMVDELDTLSQSIALIEKENFTTPLLKKMHGYFMHDDQAASVKIIHIKKILDRLDLRYNLIISAPLNLLLLWNLQQVLSLEQWKKTNAADVAGWFDALGKFEALNSFGTIRFNNPQWSFPEIRDEHFSIEARELGHPLIRENKRVNNYIDVPKSGALMVVTGSNMAGKSTYLRSVGINVILAMAGAPVCASVFRLSPVQLLSSMRIADNLEENTSTFYAELKKLKTIIEKVNNNEKVFILLDEILRGTNSLDRHTGSVALVKQLIRHDAAGIIATHDVQLAEMKKEFPENILNFHFDAQVSHDELYFDYQLKPGICTSLNASILMKKIGIEL